MGVVQGVIGHYGLGHSASKYGMALDRGFAGTR